MRYSQHQLADLKRDNPIPRIAGVALRKGRKAGWSVGPCPLCSTDSASKDATRFECSATEWVCAVCCDGGDVIRLVMVRDGLDFERAIEQLGGVKERAITARDARDAGRQAYKQGRPPVPAPLEYAGFAEDYVKGWRAADEAEISSQRFREAERQRLYEVWRQAMPIFDTEAEAYLNQRGLLVPGGAKLRFAPCYRYFHGEEDDGTGRMAPRVIHSGPAMLAAIIGNDGRFYGLHATWIDLANAPKFKAVIADPDTGEILQAKKSRGSTKAGHIELQRPIEPVRLFMGEGIETVLAIYTAMVRAGRDLSRVAFWTSVDLHNLGGPHLETIPHPVLTHANGHRVRVPSSQPDFDLPAIAIPPSVTELGLLGDGDSEPFLTTNALRRGCRRYAAPGRKIAPVMAPEGVDFNDLVMPEAVA